ncbi:S49 family peptidase [Spiribacter sp. C176]|uniref:S49 family peptidase n=1 Tax=Spiribacter salilacus TaxID=2664894 RepID=A0A6N7QLD0_9GAMM|nr:S49 family peptidase [Spiribacter salilacus]MRH77286.1 S49 family peptidase [Spiribacter salilacus]
MSDEDNWTRNTLRDIALEGVKERRRARRWGIFFKLLLVGYIGGMSILAFLPSGVLTTETATGPHAGVVRLEGPIMADSPASATNILGAIETALSVNATRGVILEINSPGGSPVQSGQIFRGINALQEQYPNKPIITVGQDIMASGAYYSAAATEEIFVDPASLVGSIGVISRGFGFTEALSRLGVERRVYSAGDEKAGLDPFMPEDPEAIEDLQTMLNEIQQQFVSAVRQGRGNRLNEQQDDLFSGRTWTGEQAVDLGLADGFGDTKAVAQMRFDTEEMVDYTTPRPLLDQLVERIGVSLRHGLFSSSFMAN